MCHGQVFIFVLLLHINILHHRFMEEMNMHHIFMYKMLTFLFAKLLHGMANSWNVNCSKCVIDLKL
jgi:hypothetical protein